MDKKKNYFRDPRILCSLCILGALALAALLGNWVELYWPYDTDLSLRGAHPSWAHPLGCDLNGGELWVSLLKGARVTLYVMTLTVLLSFTVGIFVGVVTGYQGGWLDTVLMRLLDIVMAFPGILLAMAIAAIVGPSIHTLIFAIAATGWTSTARLVRGQVMSIKEQDYVLAAIALGASTPRILWVYILPNLWSVLLISAAFSLSGVLMVEAGLSFLGLGAQDGAPTWGSLLNQGRTVLLEAPHLSLLPGLLILATVLALNFLGEGLRDYLDVR
jgi:peptide/nickel transport system permease protein